MRLALLDSCLPLQNLAKQMRERRIESGTLSIQSLRLKFDLDDTGAPVDCSEELQTEANYVVAEVRQPG